VNQLVRQCVPAWVEAGAYIVHLTGERDAEADSLDYRQYFSLPFYENMAGLLQRADFAISRAGAATLTELAATGTPALLIPYPFAAEDHQTYNARALELAGAALVCRQGDLTPQKLELQVLELLQTPDRLAEMARRMDSLAVRDSAQQLAALVRQYFRG
jgi:UDP-N-acetylglucosamine--N-acetylmuramyl-(pentapeptide) pyrophosphoryl-undecaprenol N-acetylglucosamine transferase